MRVLSGIVVIGVIVLPLAVAFAQGNSLVSIPQIQMKPSPTAKADEDEDSAVPVHNEEAALPQPDHQTQVLSDPAISDYARATTAIIGAAQATGKTDTSSTEIFEDSLPTGVNIDNLCKNEIETAHWAAQNKKAKRKKFPDNAEANAVYTKQKVNDVTVHDAAPIR